MIESVPVSAGDVQARNYTGNTSGSQPTPQKWWERAGNFLSGISPLLNVAMGAYNIFADNRNRGDYREQQLVSNQMAHDQLYNAAQIRRKDLEAAGLHPSLAAGSAAQGHAPVVGHAQRHSVQMPDLMTLSTARLHNAQAEKAMAEAAQARTSSSLDEERYALEQDKHYRYTPFQLEWEAKRIYNDIVHNAHRRSYDWSTLAHSRAVLASEDAERIAKIYALKIGADAQTITALRDALKLKYEKEHTMSMPTRNALIEDISQVLGSDAAGVLTQVLLPVAASVAATAILKRPTVVKPKPTRLGKGRR